MAIENKYRVHEVAKDFGTSTKEITEILTEYCTTPKNHMQVLGDEELSVIFEYMTQHHQVADIEQTLNAQMAARQPAQKPGQGVRPDGQTKLGQKVGEHQRRVVGQHAQGGQILQIRRGEGKGTFHRETSRQVPAGGRRGYRGEAAYPGGTGSPWKAHL